MKKMFWLISLFFLLPLSISAENLLRIATTTSTENSGLLAVLNPPFAEQYKIRLDVIAVGTGKALRLGQNGDVDVVFVHAPEAEQHFIEQGYGLERRSVMHNDFVIVGPAEDPAGIKSATSARQAFANIHSGKSTFISRGDASGTHKKEQALWLAAGITAKGEWYLSAGQGMAAVLRIADEKQVYTLTDRGTYIAYQNKIDLPILYQGDEALFNPYHIMAVNPQRFAHIRHEQAKQYIDYVTGPQGQAIIKTYKKDGQQLFYPDAIMENPEKGNYSQLEPNSL